MSELLSTLQSYFCLLLHSLRLEVHNVFQLANYKTKFLSFKFWTWQLKCIELSKLHLGECYFDRINSSSMVTWMMEHFEFHVDGNRYDAWWHLSYIPTKCWSFWHKTCQCWSIVSNTPLGGPRGIASGSYSLNVVKVDMGKKLLMVTLESMTSTWWANKILLFHAILKNQNLVLPCFKFSLGLKLCKVSCWVGGNVRW